MASQIFGFPFWTKTTTQFTFTACLTDNWSQIAKETNTYNLLLVNPDFNYTNLSYNYIAALFIYLYLFIMNSERLDERWLGTILHRDVSDVIHTLKFNVKHVIKLN